ncbi:MAG TPA: NepR family anti-sigma factor [Ramlibacter sp.]|nr:NepR family anti-sigma factor [Ramlibacter sp.]
MSRPDNDDLAKRVAAAYDDVLREPVPDRLTALLASPAPAPVSAPAPVADLGAERARRRVAPFAAWTWAQWGGMAASLAIGVLAGWQLASPGGDALLAEQGGRVIAGAPLAQALDTRLAGDGAARIAMQLSFVDRSGRYCRTFSTEQVAGLACRDGTQWAVTATAQAARDSGTAMRQAASSLPRPVLDAVDAQIAGPALDAAQEREARDRGWRR